MPNSLEYIRQEKLLGGHEGCGLAEKQMEVHT